MGAVLARTAVYGLIAAASPLAFAATVVVLRSQRARLNGIIFASAFVLGGLVVVLVVLAIGSAAAPGPGGSTTVAASLELALGVLLLVAGMRLRRGVARARAADGAGGTQAVLERLGRISPKTAFPAGALLGIGGPKRLTIGLVTATTISAAALSTRNSVLVAVVYVLIASVLVWAPVAFYVVAGRRTRAWLTEAEGWLLENQRLFGAVSLLVFGAPLVADALTRLL